MLNSSRVEVYGAVAAGGLLTAVFLYWVLSDRNKSNTNRRKLTDDDSGIDFDEKSEISDVEADQLTATDSKDIQDGVTLSGPSDGSVDVALSEQAVEATVDHVTEEAGKMSLAEAQVLTQALGTRNQDFQQKVLVSISNAAVFHKNLALLREAGCLRRLTGIINAHKMALKVDQTVAYPTVVNRVINTITNLAADEQNQQQLQECIPALIDFAKCESSPESVQVSSLQALINLSVTSSFHPPYTQLIQHLYTCLDTGSETLKLHALKVLINLSANPDMVPHLLAAKAPSTLLSSIVPRTEEDLLLRWVTLLANIMWTAREKKLTNTSLPTEYKAASPETMWTAIYGLNSSVHLRSKVFVLSKHRNQEIRYHAARIYSCLA